MSTWFEYLLYLKYQFWISEYIFICKLIGRWHHNKTCKLIGWWHHDMTEIPEWYFEWQILKICGHFGKSRMLSWINIAYTVIMCGFNQIYILNQIIRLMSFNVVSRFLPCLQRWTGVKRPKVWQGSFEQLSLWYIDDKSKINLKLMRLLYTLVSSSLCLQKDVYGLHRV